MKNIINENEANQIGEFVNQKENTLTYSKNQYSKTEQKQNKKASSKLFKGKVKVYSNNSKPNLIDDDYLDEESELNLVSERMLFFVKFIFLFLIIMTFVLLLKKNV